MRIVPPAELITLHQHFVVEEALSVIRHDIRNKLGSIRNASFYLNRKLQKAAPDLATTDPRVLQFQTLIGSEIQAAEGVLQSRLPAPREADILRAPVILRRIHDLVALPPSIRLVMESTTELHVRIDPDEAAVAMFCLLENAVDAVDGVGCIRLRVCERDDRVALEVEDDGPGFASGVHERAFEQFFTTRPSRLGLGLNISRRISTRWQGTIELVALARGVRAAMVLRRAA
jgi:signal transduction histidine kinase